MRIQPILNVLVTGAGNGIGKSVCEYYYSKKISLLEKIITYFLC